MRSLKVKCATWDHVETFYRRKLRRGNILSIRAPFCPQQGAQITLGLELPNGTVLAIDGTVIGVKPSPDGKRSTIHLSLYGMTPDILRRLEAGVALSRDESRAQEPETGTAPQANVPPAPMPADAPIDELVEVPAPPDPSALSEYERGVFDTLYVELARMRESAAHEVLEVAPDAGIADVRAAYFELARRFHPDIYARYRAPSVLRLAEEVFIHANTAYDRMRRALTPEGAAPIGPAMLPKDGWLIPFDDIHGEARLDGTADAGHALDSLPDATAAVAAREGAAGAAERAALEALEAGLLATAREVLAEALHGDPRDRRLRALYHVCMGRAARADGRETAATSHFEAALAHDPACEVARSDLDGLRRVHGGRASGVYRRFFQ